MVSQIASAPSSKDYESVFLFKDNDTCCQACYSKNYVNTKRRRPNQDIHLVKARVGIESDHRR